MPLWCITHHHCGARVGWVDPGLGSLWRCWSPHRCNFQHLRAPLWRCTNSPSPVRWSGEYPASRMSGTHWKSRKIWDLWERKKMRILTLNEETKGFFFKNIFWKGAIKHAGRKWHGLAVPVCAKFKTSWGCESYINAKVKIDDGICERSQTNVIIWTGLKWPFILWMRSAYSNRDLGDTGVRVVMTNYSSPHSQLRRRPFLTDHGNKRHETSNNSSQHESKFGFFDIRSNRITSIYTP